MSIEIRQLTIKSTILPPEPAGREGRRRGDDQLKAELLAQCRRLIAEQLSQGGDR